LAAVVRYIHLNPVEAKVVDDPGHYPWSSHHHYLRPRGAPRYLALKEVLSGYGSEGDFHEFVLSGNEEALLRYYSGKRRSPVLGGADFISWVKGGGFSASMEHVGYEAGVLKPDVTLVIKAVGEVYGVSEGEIFQRRRGERNEARQVAMYLIRDLCDKSLREIAEIFSLGSYRSVGGACSIVERRRKLNRTLAHRIKQIRGLVILSKQRLDPFFPFLEMRRPF
jgi:hypothetical protein